MKKHLISIFSLCILLACASGDRLFNEEDKKDLVEEFDLGKVDLDKFKTVSKDDYVVKPEPSVSKKKGPQKQKSKKTILATKAPIKLTSEYPEDYPEDYILYDKKYKGFWDNIKPRYFENERMLIEAKFMGIYVGTLELNSLPVVKVGNQNAFHIKAVLKSAKYYSYIYKLNDVLETFVSVEDFLPLKFVLKQRESGQTVDDLQLFDKEQKKTHFWYRRLKKGKEKRRELSTYIPTYFQDSFSSLYFVRSLDLKVGKKFEFPIVTRGKIWILNAEVTEKTKVEFRDKEIDAFKVKAETRFPGILKKKGDIVFWYSADQYQMLIKFTAKVKLGTISGETVEFTPGKKF